MGNSKKFYMVDLPNPMDFESDDSTWVNVAQFDTKQEALDFVSEYFGADENGMVNLISEIENDEEEE